MQKSAGSTQIPAFSVESEKNLYVYGGQKRNSPLETRKAFYRKAQPCIYGE